MNTNNIIYLLDKPNDWWNGNADYARSKLLARLNLINNLNKEYHSIWGLPIPTYILIANPECRVCLGTGKKYDSNKFNDSCLACRNK